VAALGSYALMGGAVTPELRQGGDGRPVRDLEGQLMVEIPVTSALADYRGRRLPIVFGGDDWVALRAAPGSDIPDVFAFGEYVRQGIR
jgi:hypothetical protein